SREEKAVFRGENGMWQAEFAITARAIRHAQLLHLVGRLFVQCGYQVARENARLQHSEANPIPVASGEEHLCEFSSAWEGMQRQWLACLTQRERAAYDELASDNEREAFRI